MLSIKNIIAGFVILLLLACNPTKDKWLNRNFHTLTGHFNVFFNGEQKLLDAIKQIESSHPDRFDQILSVQQTGTAEAAKSAGNLLDEALKKFSASIQLHQIGRYTDDSYFAIGKCRYYKQDYYTAIETFQYVLGKYKNGPFTHQSTAWIARCYVGLNKLQEAEAIMGQLLLNKTFNKEDIAFVYITAADIDLRANKPAAALEHLKKAFEGKLTREQKIRFHYILGQLCMDQKKNPEATYHFNKVIKFVPAYDYAFNANLALLSLYDLKDPKNVARVKKNLRKMAKDEKNIDYLDQIWYEMGKIDMAANNMPEAISDFKKSAVLSTKNRNQKALAYYELAKLYFNSKDFKNAQAYYDSTVQFLDPKYKGYDNIKKTKTVLSDLILNLQAYETEDSLQRLSQLSLDALERKADGWIAEAQKKKLQEEKDAKKRAKAAASAASNQNLLTAAPPTAGNAGSSSWYFYNANLISSGAAEFFSNKKWGQRANEDFWRLAAKEKPKAEAENATAGNKQKADSSSADALEPKEKNDGASNSKQVSITGNKDKDAWLKNVPLTSEQKKRSNERMLEALHNLGVIYYDQLENAQECIRYTEKLENKFPENEYEASSLYYLYKAYSDLKNNSKAEANKTKLINKYPESNYALLVQNKKPVNKAEEYNKQLLATYEKMYSLYQSGAYTEAMQYPAMLDKNWPDNALKPKYDLLYALCVAKTKDKVAFEAELQKVSNQHKGTEAAQTADNYLKVLKNEAKKEAFAGAGGQQALPEFDLETETQFFYLLGIKGKKVDNNEINMQLNGYNEAYMSENGLRVNSYMSNEGYQLFVVREFANFKQAEDYKQSLAMVKVKENKLNLTDGYVEYVISGTNFKKVLKESKIEQFESFYKKQVQQMQKVK